MLQFTVVVDGISVKEFQIMFILRLCKAAAHIALMLVDAFQSNVVCVTLNNRHWHKADLQKSRCKFRFLMKRPKVKKKKRKNNIRRKP